MSILTKMASVMREASSLKAGSMKWQGPHKDAKNGGRAAAAGGDASGCRG
jgi:hypothetical protein